MATFETMLLWFDMEYLLEPFEDDEKHGDDRAFETAFSAAQFLLSLLAVGVGDAVAYLNVSKPIINTSIQSISIQSQLESIQLIFSSHGFVNKDVVTGFEWRNCSF